jgi:hypothetical protein
MALFSLLSSLIIWTTGVGILNLAIIGPPNYHRGRGPRQLDELEQRITSGVDYDLSGTTLYYGYPIPDDVRERLPRADHNYKFECLSQKAVIIVDTITNANISYLVLPRASFL